MDTLPTIQKLTPALLSMLAAIALSLIFRYIPKARDWFDTFRPEGKQAAMGITVIAIALIIGIYNMAHVGFTEENIIALGLTIIASLMSNSTTFNFTKRPPPSEIV